MAPPFSSQPSTDRNPVATINHRGYMVVNFFVAPCPTLITSLRRAVPSKHWSQRTRRQWYFAPPAVDPGLRWINEVYRNVDVIPSYPTDMDRAVPESSSTGGAA